VADDPETRAIFEEILRDEVFHMNYSYAQLNRVSPETCRRRVWAARASRLWKRYQRAMAVVASFIGDALLTGIYFVVLGPFAWAAKRAERQVSAGWQAISGGRDNSPTSQY